MNSLILEEDANNSKQLDSADITLALTNEVEIDDFVRRYTLPDRTRATGLASKQTSTILLLIIG